jgi:cytochrome oxidase Cu insertion factor (SCO1/SenC/PrrC family)
MKLFATLVFGALLAASPTPGGPGIAVGQTAPDFTLVDQAGRKRSLAPLLEGRKLALLFFRSADW